LADGQSVFHLYVIQVPERDRILSILKSYGIGAGIHYPIPLHEQPAYQHLNLAPNALPVTHEASRSIISLPIYPEITHEQITTVVDCLKMAIAQVL
jgi:dTDP-4-amino-4,6-dideoxygalactose transaminase